MKKSGGDHSTIFQLIGSGQTRHSKRKPSTTYKPDKSLKISQINKENVERRKNIISLITKGRVSVGLYSKAKSSDVISRSRSSLKSSQSDVQITSQPVSSALPLYNDQSINMEVSPCTIATTTSSNEYIMKEISLRILTGLHNANSSFTVSVNDYTTRIKCELRKILKQSNPVAFSNIDTVIRKPLSDPLPQRHDPFSPSSLPLPVAPLPVMSDPTVEQSSSQYLTSTDNNDQFINVLLQSHGDPFLTSDHSLISQHYSTNEQQSDIPSVVIGRDIDFLDLMEDQSSSLDHSTTTVQQNVTVQQSQQNIDHIRVQQNIDQRPPNSLIDYDIVQIQGSVERPRMFPHKLY